MTTLRENLAAVEAQIEAACRKAGRSRQDVKVLLATKSVSPERIRQAAQLGYTLCGENKAQELGEKIGPLADLAIEWHFIGHLQSNKVKDVIDHCRLIHSVDRLSLAQEISKRAQAKGRTCPILIEVNTSGEDSKSGVAPENALALCREIAELPGVAIHGLMTLAVNSSDETAVRGCFRRLRQLADDLRRASLKNVEMRELSMGMSQDYPLAIEEGATLIRLGSVIFGSRT